MATEKSKKVPDRRRIFLGRFGERLAEKHLKTLGYKIIGKNVVTKHGEIDLVIKNKDEIIFVEVKTLKNPCWIRPVESVDWKKRKKLSQLGSEYLRTYNVGKCPVSFMVVGVDLSKNAKDRFEVIPNAFWVE